MCNDNMRKTFVSVCTADFVQTLLVVITWSLHICVINDSKVLNSFILLEEIIEYVVLRIFSPFLTVMLY